VVTSSSRDKEEDDKDDKYYRSTNEIGLETSDRPAASILDGLIEEQSTRLGARNNPSIWNKPRHRRGLSLSDSQSETSEETLTAVTRWSNYLKTLPTDFFTSSEARVQAQEEGPAVV
jgi:hypothetical protein